MPAERTVIYNRRASSTGPVTYADDSLEEELNVGRDIKIMEDENESSSVASYELVSSWSVYLLKWWQASALISQWQLELLKKTFWVLPTGVEAMNDRVDEAVQVRALAKVIM